LLDHKLIVTSSSSKERDFDLADGLNVSTFYHQLFNILDGLDINALIKARPYDIKLHIPFAEDTFHKSYTKIRYTLYTNPAADRPPVSNFQ